MVEGKAMKHLFWHFLQHSLHVATLKRGWGGGAPGAPQPPHQLRLACITLPYLLSKCCYHVCILSFLFSRMYIFHHFYLQKCYYQWLCICKFVCFLWNFLISWEIMWTKYQKSLKLYRISWNKVLTHSKPEITFVEDVSIVK